MAPRVRLVAVALLTAGAIVAVRLRAGTLASDRSAEQLPTVPAGDLGAAITWLMAVTVPLLGLLVVLSFGSMRRRVREPDDRGWTHATTRGLVFAIALTTTAVVVLAMVARLGGRSRDPGATASVPPSQQDTGPDPTVPSGRVPPGERGGGSVDFDQMAAFVVAALLVLLVSALIAGRVPRAPAGEIPQAHAPSSHPHALIVATQRALSAVDEPAPDARTAIVRCYAALERALSGTPGAAPRPADTPTEVIRRAVEAGTVDQGPGQRLAELFAEARFSDHTMSERDRLAAAGSLRLILNQLEAAAWTRS